MDISTDKMKKAMLAYARFCTYLAWSSIPAAVMAHQALVQ